MEFHQKNPSSLQKLIEELEKLIAIESAINDTPWICVSKLTEVFYQKHGVSLEVVAKERGYSDGLGSLLISSGHFSIYDTPIPQKFYVALLQSVVPSAGFRQSQETSLAETLLAEISLAESVEISKYQPILVAEIESVTDLEIALIEIIKILTANHPKKIVTIAVLSKKFRDYYKQAIRTVIRSVCPDVKLIELLQSIPGLDVQKVDRDWQITVDSSLLQTYSYRTVIGADTI